MTGLIIIDDEREQVEGIKSIINWEVYGIEVIGIANNGRDGLALIEKESPDIAIIDIRMPLMDGLELIEKINEKKIKLQTIILSGYDDFSYAQKAIELKTCNYLLKPCAPEEILQAVLKAKNNLSEENQRNFILEKYKNIYQENLPLLKEKFLTGLIEGKTYTQKQVSHKIQNYSLKLTGEYYCIVIFSPDQYKDDSASEDREYLFIGVQDLIRQILSKEYLFEVFQYQNNITLIVTLEDKRSNSFTYSDLLQTLILSLNKIKGDINLEYDTSFTIGIGEPVSKLKELWRSYQQAYTAVESRFFYGENRVVLYNPNLSTESTNYLYPLKEEQEILSCLERGDADSLKGAVHHFFTSTNNNIFLSKNYTHKTCMTLLSNIMHFCLSKNIQLENITNDVFKTFDEIIQTDTIEQLQEKIISFLSEIISDIKENNQTKGFIQYTIDYIHGHYQENLNLKTIANQVHISPSYLSLLFKQETGTNFIDYLNSYRLEKAKELLRDPRFKISEIAYKVGYNDEKYFYQVFKRYTGLTASQFRDSISI